MLVVQSCVSANRRLTQSRQDAKAAKNFANLASWRLCVRRRFAETQPCSEADLDYENLVLTQSRQVGVLSISTCKRSACGSSGIPQPACSSLRRIPVAAPTPVRSV